MTQTHTETDAQAQAETQAASSAQRLSALRQLGNFKEGPDPVLDTVVALAAQLFEVPMAAVHLVDDQAQRRVCGYGLPYVDISRSQSLCAISVDTARPLIIPDASADPRSAGLDGVRNSEYASYAGVPLTGRDGVTLGTLCVADTRPRHFEPARVEVLNSLAQLAAEHMDLRRAHHAAGADPSTVRTDAAELRAALDSGQLRLAFQPVVDLSTGRARAVEALLRWQHPVRGTLLPKDFLPQAEVAGLGARMDSWALREAVATVAAWRAWVPELAGLTVAVNVCLSSIDGAQWAKEVLDVLLKYGLPTSALTLEVSERSAGNASPVALAALRTLVEAGCQVAIDDIGTGTSTLARLVDLPVTQLKIDQRFVGSMATDPRAEAVTRTLAHLGKTMGLDVVAEGVEDAPTAELALKSGCTSGQGYHWSHPKWEEELVLALLLDKHLTAQRQA